MHIHPDIAALRSDRAPQREAQSAMLAASNAWEAEEGATELREELKSYGAGAPLQHCPTLQAVFAGEGEADRLMGLWAKHYCEAIAANPIGHPPFRIGFDGVGSSILLARSGRAQLMLQAREPGQISVASHIFTDATRFDAVLAGKAKAHITRLIDLGGDGAQFEREAIQLRAGHRLAFDLSTEALAIDAVEKRLVVLRLMRVADEPEPSREYCAQTSRFLQQSAGKISTSRLEAIMALLGRMDREDAVPFIAQIAMDDGDTSMRWLAVREALALDSAEGFRALCTIARRADDPLAAKAGALRAQLLETYPQFATLEAASCPA